MSTTRGGGGRARQRSRIVVNVEPPEDKRARRRKIVSLLQPRSRGGRLAQIVLFVVLAFIFGALAGGFFWWQSYKSSPEYSLALLVDAARRDDKQTFETLVDVDQITGSMLPQVIAQAAEHGNARAIAPALRRRIEASAATFVPGAHEQMRDATMQAIKDAVAKGAGSWPFIVYALAVPRTLDQIREDDQRATMTFKINARPVELTMQRNGERWRVVSLKSDELAARIADKLTPALPSFIR